MDERPRKRRKSVPLVHGRNKKLVAEMDCKLCGHRNRKRLEYRGKNGGGTLYGAVEEKT